MCYVNNLTVSGTALGIFLLQQNRRRNPTPVYISLSITESLTYSKLKCVVKEMLRYKSEERPSMEDVKVRVDQATGRII